MQDSFEKENQILVLNIPNKEKENEVYMLADDVNRHWLPAKLKQLQNSLPTKPLLSAKDINPSNSKYSEPNS